MTLRTKLVVALAMLAGMSSAIIAGWSYRTTADRLDAQIDQSLDDAANRIGQRIAREGGVTTTTPGGQPFDRLPGPFGERPRSFEQILVQAVDGTGAPQVNPAGLTLPLDDAERQLASTGDAGTAVRRDVTVDGEPYRMETIALGNGEGAVQLARSLAENQQVLDQLRRVTLFAVALVTLVAAALGWVIAHTVTRRLERLTDAADEVAETGRLDVAVPVGGSDEAGRLGTAFAAMLGALARSRDAQARLVQDAGHELRSPLTSMRTNLAVLHRYDTLDAEARDKVLGDLEGEARELSDLVDELVELATDIPQDGPEELVELGALADRVAERFRRRSDHAIVVTADDSLVRGVPARLERAMANLVDNAIKFDPDGDADVELRVVAGRVEVADRGPGIGPDDLPHVFERFFRAAESRSRTGSGLGLAIVHDVVERHGGRVFATARPGGGAVVGFTLPLAAGTGAAFSPDSNHPHTDT